MILTFLILTHASNARCNAVDNTLRCLRY